MAKWTVGPRRPRVLMLLVFMGMRRTRQPCSPRWQGWSIPGGMVAITDEVEHGYEWMRTEQIWPNGLHYPWTDAFGVVLYASLSYSGIL